MGFLIGRSFSVEEIRKRRKGEYERKWKQFERKVESKRVQFITHKRGNQDRKDGALGVNRGGVDF